MKIYLWMHNLEHSAELCWLRPIIRHFITCRFKSRKSLIVIWFGLDFNLKCLRCWNWLWIQIDLDFQTQSNQWQKEHKIGKQIHFGEPACRKTSNYSAVANKRDDRKSNSILKRLICTVWLRNNWECGILICSIGKHPCCCWYFITDLNYLSFIFKLKQKFKKNSTLIKWKPPNLTQLLNFETL